MNFEKYTDRARGFVQSAQSLALREGHQQFAPEHLLKVLLDDPEGLAAGLIDRSGGNARQALQQVETALAKRPKVSGAGAGQVYLDAALARVFDAAEKAGEKAGDSFPTRKYRMTYDDENEVFSATCDEYPALKWTSKSKRDALLGIKSIVRDHDNWAKRIAEEKKKRGGGAAAAPADGTAETPVQVRPPSTKSKRTKGNVKEKGGV